MTCSEGISRFFDVYYMYFTFPGSKLPQDQESDGPDMSNIGGQGKRKIIFGDNARV